MTTLSKIAVIITAAGSSTKMGGSIKKEYLPLDEGTVLSACAKAFINTSKNLEQKFLLSRLIVTIPENGIKEAKTALSDLFTQDNSLEEKIKFIQGGSTRQKSVFNALEYIRKSETIPDYVLIHDGARPFVSEKIIQQVIVDTQEFGAAAPGITPTDTIKTVDENGFIIKHLQRKALTAIQTPQGFVFEKLFEAHKKAASENFEYTDDTEIWDKYFGKIKLVSGDPRNIKITYPGDLERGAGAKADTDTDFRGGSI